MTDIPPIRVALFNETKALGHHGCTLVSRQIHALATATGLQIVHAVAGDGDGRAARFISDCDLVLINGEGSIHSGNANAHRLSALAPLARSMGKPAVLINALYQDNPAEVAERLRNLDAIWVRDLRSQAQLADQGLEAQVVPDLTLSWEPPVAPAADLAGPRQIVITDSTLRGTSRALYDLCRRMQRAGRPVRFLPFKARPPVMSSKRDHGLRRLLSFKVKRGAALLSPVASYRRDRYSCIVPEFDQCITLLQSRAEGVVAGRFHALCLALVLGVPVVAVGSNTHKVEALLAAAGLSGRMLGEVPGMLDGIAPYTDTEQKQRLAFLADCRVQAANMFRQIAEIARRSS